MPRTRVFPAIICLMLAALSLGACQTFTLEEYAQAANDLDPKCGKRIHLEVTPIIIGFWVIPVISGSYDKSCNPDQFGAPLAPLVPGRVLGGLPAQ